jgi:adenylate cyclase class IV
MTYLNLIANIVTVSEKQRADITFVHPHADLLRAAKYIRINKSFHT